MIHCLVASKQNALIFTINNTFYWTKKVPVYTYVHSIHSARHHSKHPHHHTNTESHGHMGRQHTSFVQSNPSSETRAQTFSSFHGMESIIQAHRLQTRSQAFSSFHGPESIIQAHLLPRLADEKIPGFDLAWQAPAERQQGKLSQPFFPSKRDECQRIAGAVSCQFAVGQTIDQ